MSWGEAVRLATVLAGDPSSHLFAAMAKWTHPASREWLLLADIYDAFANVNFKKPKPYPRPMPDAGVESYGTKVAPADIPAMLAAFGRPVAA